MKHHDSQLASSSSSSDSDDSEESKYLSSIIDSLPNDNSMGSLSTVLPFVSDLDAFLPCQKPFLTGYLATDSFQNMLKSLDITLDVDQLVLLPLENRRFNLVVSIRSLFMNLHYQVQLVTKDGKCLGPWFGFKYTDEMLESILLSYFNTAPKNITLLSLHMVLLLISTDLDGLIAAISQAGVANDQSQLSQMVGYHSIIYKIFSQIIASRPECIQSFLINVANEFSEYLQQGYDIGQLRYFSTAEVKCKHQMRVSVRNFSVQEVSQLCLSSAEQKFDRFTVPSSSLINVQQGKQHGHSVHDYEPLKKWFWMCYAASVLYGANMLDFSISTVMDHEIQKVVKSDGLAVALFLTAIDETLAASALRCVSPAKKKKLYCQYVNFFLPVWNPAKSLLIERQFIIKVPYRYAVDNKKQHKAVCFEVSLCSIPAGRCYRFDYKVGSFLHAVGPGFDLCNVLTGTVFLSQVFTSQITLLLSENAELGAMGLLKVIKSPRFSGAQLSRLFAKLQGLNRDLGVENLNNYLDYAPVPVQGSAGRLRLLGGQANQQGAAAVSAKALKESDLAIAQAKQIFGLSL